MRHESRRLGRMCAVVLALGQATTCAGSAADRAVLSAVTPDTLGLGEEVKIRWDYDDGNGGERNETLMMLYIQQYCCSRNSLRYCLYRVQLILLHPACTYSSRYIFHVIYLLEEILVYSSTTYSSQSCRQQYLVIVLHMIRCIYSHIIYTSYIYTKYYMLFYTFSVYHFGTRNTHSLNMYEYQFK